MKVFSINGYFLLPDDFEGGYQEALEAYVEYRKKKRLSTKPSSKRVCNPQNQEEMWGSFMQLVRKQSKKRFVGNIAVGEWKDGKWSLFHK